MRLVIVTFHWYSASTVRHPFPFLCHSVNLKSVRRRAQIEAYVIVSHFFSDGRALISKRCNHFDVDWIWWENEEGASFLTRTLLVFRGWLVGPTVGRLADAGPVRQTCLCLSEMRQRLHLEGKPSASLEHWLRITTDVLLQIVRLQNQQEGHTLQAHETRAFATSGLA